MEPLTPKVQLGRPKTSVLPPLSEIWESAAVPAPVINGKVLVVHPVQVNPGPVACWTNTFGVKQI
jgi:hypothetical protein